MPLKCRQPHIKRRRIPNSEFGGVSVKHGFTPFQTQIMMLFQHLCLMLLFAVTNAAFCSITNDVSFTLTTFNTTDVALNNTLVDISACGTVGLKQPSATGGALVAHFSNGGIWRYSGSSDAKEPGFLTKRPGGGGYLFKFSKTPPADAVLRTFEIGCDYSGRHFLGINGYDWQACKQPKGGYAVWEFPPPPGRSLLHGGIKACAC
jgi:hypothetical protein